MYGQYFYFYPHNQAYQAPFVYQQPPPFSFPTFSQQISSQSENTPIKTQPECTQVEVNQTTLKQEEPVQPPSSPRVSRFKYAKKNVESNVVNQVISYITTKNKSRKVLIALFKSNEKVDAFYEIMRQAKKQHCGYMGRVALQNMLEADEVHPIYILHKKLKSRIQLKMNQIKRALRLLSNHFLRNIIVPTLLTSSKLDKSTIQQHLMRAREIYCFLNNLPSPYGN